MTTPPTIHLYSRVSTLAQADDGHSLDAQARALRAYVDLHRLSDAPQAAVVDYVDRAVSGAMPLGDRPAGERLLAAVQSGDTVVATKLDRMFRSALDALSALEHFREAGVALHLIDLGGDVCGNGIARLVFTILSAVAEAERERIGERIRDVVADRRKRGMWLGGARAPFGYDVGEYGKLVENPHEQASLVVARDMRARGASYRTIATALAERGTPLSWQGVGRALGREEARAALVRAALQHKG